MPLFSIVVPVYNVKKYIRKCLDSIVNQTFKDFEVVLVDDGSTDGSSEICDEYAKKDQRFKVIHKKNGGLLSARRTGLQYVIGEYILHCDSDDYYSVNLLDNIKNAISVSDADMILFGYIVINDEERVLEEHFNIFENESFQSKESVIYKLATTTWLNNMVTKAVKKSCVDIENDYKEYGRLSMGEDLLQLIRLVENCNSFYYVAAPYYYYRFNQQSISKNIKLAYLDEYFIISAKLEGLIKKNILDSLVIDAFYDRFVHDIYKYLLRFLQNGITKADYLITHQKAEENKIFSKAWNSKCKMRLTNRLFYFMLKPRYYYLSRFFVNNILRGRFI